MMTAPAASRGARIAATAPAVGIGIAVAVKAWINGELGKRLDDAAFAAARSDLALWPCWQGRVLPGSRR